MANKNRLAQLEKNAPKDKPQVNPYMAMSDEELLQVARDIVKSNPDDTSEAVVLAKRIIQNSGNKITDKAVTA